MEERKEGMGEKGWSGRKEKVAGRKEKSKVGRKETRGGRKEKRGGRKEKRGGRREKGPPTIKIGMKGQKTPPPPRLQDKPIHVKMNPHETKVGETQRIFRNN